ncbi:MAG: hypothetical protein JRI55_00825, partial [Deltaproteobacteria bacterium]|nr:hypothetical protein [Deltaproteobacteria bacterium]
DCVDYSDEYTCSEVLDPPQAVQNHGYSCSEPGNICCQPLEADGGVDEYCNDQPDMGCSNGCNEFEVQRDDYYCAMAGVACCEDLREPCADIGGSCELAVACPDGTEANSWGNCDSFWEFCCTPIDPSNSCGLAGGTCVGWGESCPLLHQPDPLNSCGDLTQMCCIPMF